MKKQLQKPKVTPTTEKDRFNWDKLMKTPLSYDLARIKNKTCTQKEAATQIATAIHEAVHIFYGVMGSHFIRKAVVPTNQVLYIGGQEAIGFTEVYDDNSGWYAIMSRMGAALFDWILAGFELTNPAEWDFNEALYSIDIMRERVEWDNFSNIREKDVYVIQWIPRKNNKEDYELGGGTNQFLFESALANAWFGFNGVHYWAIIRAIAISLLLTRDKKDGVIQTYTFKLIVNWLSKFSPYNEARELPLVTGVPTFQEDIKWLWKAHTINSKKGFANLKRFDHVCREQRHTEIELQENIDELVLH